MSTQKVVLTTKTLKTSTTTVVLTTIQYSSARKELVMSLSNSSIKIIIIIIATQGRVVYGERRHAEPPGGNDHPQLLSKLILTDRITNSAYFNEALVHFKVPLIFIAKPLCTLWISHL
jgi:hypothetical protein